MTKKVLIISASPRKGGNSDLLCDQFMKGAEASGHTVEKIFLRNYNIGYCMGCGVCNTTHKCVLNDDMKNLLPKLVEADVIVLATPVYFYTMDAQMKTLIDRTVPRYTEISNKDFYVIVSAADDSRDNMQRTIEGFRGFYEDCLEGVKEKGIIYGTGAWNIGDIKELPVMEEAFDMGKAV